MTGEADWSPAFQSSAHHLLYTIRYHFNSCTHTLSTNTAYYLVYTTKGLLCT